MNPSHKKQLDRLRRIEGQIRGIASMVAEERYCVDILTQIKAASNALKKVELEVMETHLRHCVKESMSLKDEVEVDQKINEIIELLNRRS